MKKFLITCALLSPVTPLTAYGQSAPAATATSHDASKIVSKYFTDTKFHTIKDELLVPSSPAFSILGVSPENVIRPSDPKEFSAAFLNGLDPSGILQTGVAIEFSPHVFFGGGKTSLQDYRNHYWRRLMSRTQFSYATTKAASDGDEAMRMAFGFRTVLFDGGDVRWNKTLKAKADTELQTLTLQALDISTKVTLTNRCRLVLNNNTPAAYLEMATSDNPTCPVPPPDLLARITMTTDLTANNDFRQQLLALVPSNTELQQQALEAARVAAATRWKTILKNFKKSAWNATNVTIGGAMTLASEEGGFGDLGDVGYAAYFTAAYGFEQMAGSGLDDNAHFIAHVRYQTNQLVTAVEEGMTPFNQDLLTVGAQLRIRGPELEFSQRETNKQMMFFGEVDYMRAEPDGMPTDASMRYAVGIDIPIAKQMSFQISAGEETGSETKIDSTFVLGDLKWSF